MSNSAFPEDWSTYSGSLKERPTKEKWVLDFTSTEDLDDALTFLGSLLNISLLQRRTEVNITRALLGIAASLVLVLSHYRIIFIVVYYRIVILLYNCDRQLCAYNSFKFE